MKFYEVGGCVRDEYLGKKSKDVDFAVEAESFAAMEAELRARGFKIFESRAEFLTIRAQVPASEEALRARTKDADFVLCRKDSDGSDGRRPDFVEVGNIYDDLRRRDFTMNAIARDVATGEILDPHGGRDDISLKKLRFVGNPYKRIQEDGLRVLRGIRFMITKGFDPDPETEEALKSWIATEMLLKVSIERVRDELTKMFAHNSIEAMQLLVEYRNLCGSIFRDNLWLLPTTKT